MYEESVLVARIASQTGYSTELTHDNIANTLSTATTIKIYVGHRGIRLKDQTTLYSDGYEELDTQEVLLTVIQIICPRTQFVTARKAVRMAYKHYSPIDSSDFSNLFFLEGHVLAVAEGNILYEELIGLMYLQ